MKIKSIFIANLAEVAKSLTEMMTKERKDGEIFEDHALCDRFIFNNSSNCVLVTPFPLDKDFITDACHLCNYTNFHNYYPEKISESLCRSIVNDRKLLNKIIKIIKTNPGLKIHSYVASEEFSEFIKFLKNKKLNFKAAEMPEDNNSWTTAFFDSKAGFRQIIPELGPGFPKMPFGIVCHRKDEIIGLAKYLIKTGDGCVIKANRGLAGAGLKIFRKSELKSKNVSKLINALLKSEPYWEKDSVIVEDFISPDMTICGGAPNIELKIETGRVIPLYSCGMRVTPEGVFIGVEIGRGAVPDNLRKKLRNYGKKLGKFLNRFGYQGFFEIDWVMGKDRLYPIEANLRRTGGTHVYDLAKRIIGRDFEKKSYILARNITPTKTLKNKNYSVVKKALEEILYPIKGKKEGVVITIINYLQKGNLGYIVIADDKQRAYKIEATLIKKLN